MLTRMAKRPQNLSDFMPIPIPIVTLSLRALRLLPRFGKFSGERLNLVGGVADRLTQRVPQLIVDFLATIKGLTKQLTEWLDFDPIADQMGYRDDETRAKQDSVILAESFELLLRSRDEKV